jgi:POTRA domain-containing ShlB-type protein
LAGRITDLYREHGYILARAYVPAQEMRDGAVEIAVVEGRVGKIDINGLRHYNPEFVRRYVVPPPPGRVFEASALERGLLNLNDLPGLSVKSTLTSWVISPCGVMPISGARGGCSGRRGGCSASAGRTRLPAAPRRFRSGRQSW